MYQAHLNSDFPKEHHMPRLELKVHMDHLPDALGDPRLEAYVVLALVFLEDIPPDRLEVLPGSLPMYTNWLHPPHAFVAPPYNHIPGRWLLMAAKYPTHVATPNRRRAGGEPLAENR